MTVNYFLNLKIDSDFTEDALRSGSGDDGAGTGAEGFTLVGVLKARIDSLGRKETSSSNLLVGNHSGGPCIVI